MNEEKLGRVLAITEALASDVRDIKQNMITRREFDLRVAEHSVFREGIDELSTKVDVLESNHDKGHWLRKIFDRGLFILIGIGVTALVAAIFGG